MVSKSNQIRLASPLEFDSIADGPGLRIVLWTQGCIHNCPGCHNPQTHDVHGGELFDVDTLIQQIQSSNLQSGITLSGGDPFLQPLQLLPIVKACKEKGLNIWAYSGYTYEQILSDPDKKALLQEVDILVDGRFVEALKDYRLWYKGSCNQRIIDVQASLAQGTIIISDYDENNRKIAEEIAAR